MRCLTVETVNPKIKVLEEMRAFKGRVESMLSNLEAKGAGVSYHGMVDHVTLTKAHSEAGFW